MGAVAGGAAGGAGLGEGEGGGGIPNAGLSGSLVPGPWSQMLTVAPRAASTPTALRWLLSEQQGCNGTLVPQAAELNCLVPSGHHGQLLLSLCLHFIGLV